MRSEKQRQASRNNGAKSKGPTTREGKDISRFNRLKHGLRAGQVVLPGESAAEFQAELKGWADDWRPASHTAAVLVERAAVASWRLRRCVRAEADLVLGIAAEKAGDERRAGEDDDDVDARVELADEMLHHEAAEALRELKSFPEGVDRLLWRWGDLEEVLDDGAEAWDSVLHHGRVMMMLGLGPRDDPAGPLAEASDRLGVANDRRLKAEGRDGLLAEPGASEMVARLRAGIARERRELRALRDSLAAPDPGDEAAPDATFAGVSPELMLMHRYEMGIERQLRATIKDLSALRKAGPGPGPADAIKTEPLAIKDVKKTDPDPKAEPGPAPPAAPTEPEPAALAGRPRGYRRRRGGRPRPPGRPGDGRSAS